MTAYGAGLRISEACALGLADLGSKRSAPEERWKADGERAQRPHEVARHVVPGEEGARAEADVVCASAACSVGTKTLTSPADGFSVLRVRPDLPASPSSCAFVWTAGIEQVVVMAAEKAKRRGQRGILDA